MFDFTRDSLKLKVLLGYGLSFITIFFACYVVIESYNNLKISIDKISSPNTQLIKINKIVTSLSEAENNFQLFSVSKNTMYLRRYRSRVDDIKLDLVNLNANVYHNVKSKILIDSMCNLLDTRNRELRRYLYFMRNYSNKYSDTLKSRLGQIKDSSRTKIIINTTIDFTIDTLETIVPKKKKSFLGRLFTKKKNLNPDTLKTILVRKENIIDSTFIVQPDTLLSGVDNLLSLAKKKDIDNKKIISYRTIKLIRTNIKIITKLKLLVDELEKEYLIKVQRETNNTRNIAENSILIISLVLGVGFLISVIFILIVFRDISKSNFYKLKLVKAKKEAEDLGKVKEEFLANMSHEIRTPLNSIIGFTHLLKNSPLINEQKSNVEIIESSSKHLLYIVNDILNLSKLQANEYVINKLAFKPYNLGYDIYELLSVEATDRGIDFNYIFKGDKKAIYISDSFRIKQMIINIVNNAIKFTPEGKVDLIITLGENNLSHDNLAIVIKDTGIGIKENKLKSIFDSFTQGEIFTERKYGGTGLGLSISKKILDLLDGNIEVKSEYFKGSEFIINIPIEKSNQTSLERKNERIEFPEELKKYKFLIAEDDKYSRLLIEKIFMKLHLDADFVSNGKLAIKALENIEYDMLITDINMPELNGLDLCKYIRASKKFNKIPILGLTANVRRTDIEKYISIGMNNCILKPFNENDLVRIIADCFEIETLIIDESIQDTTNKDLLESDSVSTKNLMYSLEDIKQFIGDDKELLLSLIDTFISSAEESCLSLENALDKKDFLEIGSIAHRMLSSYNQMKIISIVPILKELDDILHKSEHLDIDEKYIAGLVKNVKQLSDKLISQLHNNI